MSKELLDKIIDYNYGEFGTEFGDALVDLKNDNERLNNILEQIKEYIEYSLNNPFADEKMILEMILTKIKVELKGSDNNE